MEDLCNLYFIVKLLFSAVLKQSKSNNCFQSICVRFNFVTSNVSLLVLHTASRSSVLLSSLLSKPI